MAQRLKMPHALNGAFDRFAIDHAAAAKAYVQTEAVENQPILETNAFALDFEDQKYFPSENPLEANLPVRAISSYSLSPTTRKPRVYFIALIPAPTSANIPPHIAPSAAPSATPFQNSSPFAYDIAPSIKALDAILTPTPINTGANEPPETIVNATAPANATPPITHFAQLGSEK